VVEDVGGELHVVGRGVGIGRSCPRTFVGCCVLCLFTVLLETTKPT
jgi:hypothetical protein